MRGRVLNIGQSKLTRMRMLHEMVHAAMTRSRESVQEENKAIEDMPEDFMDPLLWIPMTDPVILPSGYTIDRYTLTRHLLERKTDPFDRSPLSLENVRPNLKLKERITLYLAQHPIRKST